MHATDLRRTARDQFGHQHPADRALELPSDQGFIGWSVRALFCTERFGIIFWADVIRVPVFDVTQHAGHERSGRFVTAFLGLF